METGIMAHIPTDELSGLITAKVTRIRERAEKRKELEEDDRARELLRQAEALEFMAIRLPEDGCLLDQYDVQDLLFDREY